MSRRGFVGPLILLAVGFILLFNNLGIVPWEIWTTLWRYWPVILILAGLEILVCCNGSKVTYLIAILIGVIIITGSVMLAMSGVPPSDYAKNMARANLNDMDLRGRDMNFADLKGANLSNSDLDGANLNFASFEDVDLSNASLNGANLNFASFEDTNLSNASLKGANLNFANLRGTNMAGARIDGANLFGAGTSGSTICPDSRQGPCW
ncbi:MAG: pentapeptide repeat-containing protein [Candidatus Methanoperedens sp.]|nr:pentapeptide repeat-containing protein [Candidatus Methanoperedens sp.]